MTERKRTKKEGFISMKLPPELLKRLDTKVAEVLANTGSGNRSSVIRMAIIDYLDKPQK